MNNYIKNEKILSNDRITGYFNGHPVFVLLDYKYSEKIKPSQFYNLNDILIDGKRALLIEVIKKSVFEFTSVLFNDVKSTDNLIKILNLFIDNKIQNINWTKLRGDFAEALYIQKFGGYKIPNEQKFDIQKEDQYFEIKSFSNSVGTVMIKQSQIKDDIKIIGVSLRIGDFKTILDLADEIDDREFSDQLKNKYNETNGGLIGFVCEGIWELKSSSQNLDNNIIDANLIFEVNSIKGVEL